MRVDLLYVYRVLPWLGPYVRAGFLSTVFPGRTQLTDNTAVVEVDAAGAPVRSLGTHSGSFKLSSPFAPIELKGGTGLGFVLQGSSVYDANFRTGLGARKLYNRGLFTPRDDASTPELELLRRGDASQWGFEATLVGSLRISRFVSLTTELDFLAPVGDVKNPIVDWDTTVSLRLVSFLSINYLFTLLNDSERSDKLQTEHRVLLRFAWRIF